jgi:uncharacterized membrane protein
MTGLYVLLKLAHVVGAGFIAATARIVVIADTVFHRDRGRGAAGYRRWLGRDHRYSAELAMDRCIAGALRPGRRVLAARGVGTDQAARSRQRGTLFRVWFILGWPAFAGVVAILALMIAKPTF